MGNKTKVVYVEFGKVPWSYSNIDNIKTLADAMGIKVEQIALFAR